MSERHVRAGKLRAQQFTSAHQSKAGKASYRMIVRRFLEIHWPDLDRAAQALTGHRRAKNYRYSKGLTAAYMRKWAVELGMLSEKEQT